MKPLTPRRRLRLYEQDATTNDEADLPDAVETLCELITEEMRMEGYIPLLDLTPRIENHYYASKDEFNVRVGLYGIYVGRKKAADYEGVSNWKLYKRSSTQRDKLSQ